MLQRKTQVPNISDKIFYKHYYKEYIYLDKFYNDAHQVVGSTIYSYYNNDV